MRVAIIHYWLVGMRGGERVLEQLCALFPDADIFTHVLRPEKISPSIARHHIETTFINKLPFAATQYTKYLPLMPRALEELDLSAYPLVISSESGPAKGVIVRPTGRHICYCHSPPRYLWDHYHLYKQDLNPLARIVFEQVAHRMRQWDVTSAARVDRFVANSSFVAERIARYYRRNADVIHPPIALDHFHPSAAPPRDFYLVVGELVRYKKVDLVVDAFRGLDREVWIAGSGEMRAELEKSAPPNVKFLGRVSEEKLIELYGSCRALLFPGEEDFGLVPLEAMASGRPVIAFGSGGALDSVKENVTGLFFVDQTAAGLRQAIEAFEAREAQFDPAQIRGHADHFSAERFKRDFMAVVHRELEHASSPW